MLRNFFKTRPTIIETHNSYRETEAMCKEEHISKSIEEQRQSVELYRFGVPEHTRKSCFNEAVQNFLA